jgi:hypothetical protein
MLNQTRFVKPTVGSKLRVVTRYPNKSMFRTSEWDDRTYVGTVMADERWTPSGSFRLHTGVVTFPVSTIALDQVHSLEYFDGTVAEKEEIEPNGSWIVKGSNGNEYVVTKSKGSVKCTCPGFTFRRNCKHIEGYK